MFGVLTANGGVECSHCEHFAPRAVWYTSPMNEYKEAVDAAERAVEHARQVRAHHRRRTDKQSVQRKTDIQLALDRLRETMAPLRSHLGRFPYLPESHTIRNARERMLDVSQEIQTERRKLWKMK